MQDELTRLLKNRDATMARIGRLEEARATSAQLDEQRDHLAAEREDVLGQISRLEHR